MRDKGIDFGLIREQDDSKRDQRGWTKGFFGFRKMFRDYLDKLNVAYYDACCPAASDEGTFPVRYNTLLQRLEYFNGTTWVDIVSIAETTSTTTTTTAATTTTTTAAPTTTTTTTVPSDVRLKQNIAFTGNTIGGLNEYTWEWNGIAKGLNLGHHPTKGVLAQEAIKVYPQYVMLDESIGYYVVDYNAIANS